MILRAAFLPAPMAFITVAAPVTISPPANTPGMEVARFSSTVIPPQGSVFKLSVLLVKRGLGVCPMAMMILSTAGDSWSPEPGLALDDQNYLFFPVPS